MGIANVAQGGGFGGIRKNGLGAHEIGAEAERPTYRPHGKLLCGEVWAIKRGAGAVHLEGASWKYRGRSCTPSQPNVPAGGNPCA